MSENYFGGIPTKVDVERLIDEIGIPKEGDETREGAWGPRL